jgi:hypothetical protein
LSIVIPYIAALGFVNYNVVKRIYVEEFHALVSTAAENLVLE